MSTQRSYDDPCGIARALDSIGERWALLVVRELLLGPKRFTDLRAGLPTASPNVLSQRLRELEGCGVLQRRVLPQPAGVSVYELTAWGRSLEPVLLSLARWGSRRAITSERDLSVDALLIALKVSMGIAVIAHDPVLGGTKHVPLRTAGTSLSCAQAAVPTPCGRANMP
ncbi:MAG TPA: helix-turn-helix domain-containing protein, partial [Roseateles sp.]